MSVYRASSGIQFNYERTTAPVGTPTVVMLHGFAQNLTTFDETVGFMGSQFDLLRLDITGHGCSDKPHTPEHYAIGKLVADIHDLLEGLGVSQPVLLGYSMGGRIAIEYALRYASDISGLVLESAGLGPRDDNERQGFIARNEGYAALLREGDIQDFFIRWNNLPLFSTQQGLPALKLASIFDAQCACDPEALALTFEGSGAQNMGNGRAFLKATSLRTLYIAGRRDARYSVLAQGIDGLHNVSISVEYLDCGHDCHLEAPREYARLLARWLIGYNEGIPT